MVAASKAQLTMVPMRSGSHPTQREARNHTNTCRKQLHHHQQLRQLLMNLQAALQPVCCTKVAASVSHSK
jgi:hypothetical protein